MTRATTIVRAAAAACIVAACREAIPPARDANAAAPVGRSDVTTGALAGVLVTNASGLDATLVPLARAEVVMVRVADLLPQFEPRDPADGGGGPLEHCGGVEDGALRATSGDDGAFAIGGLAEGSYDVTVVAQDGTRFTAYCALQIPGGAEKRVRIYVPPGTLSAGSGAGAD